MKKVLMILGVAFLVLILAFVGLLVWAHGAGEKQQEKFFQTVGTGNPDEFLAMCDPIMADEVDKPVLKMWMDGLNKQLGAYKGLSKADFSASSKTENGKKVVESEGKTLFEKGEAQTKLRSINGKIVYFKVESEKLQPKDWFVKPAMEFYRRQGETMIELLLTGKESNAREMMHPELQKVYPLEKARAEAKTVLARIGPVKSVELDEEEYTEGDSPVLIIKGTVTGQKGKVTAAVKYQFIGMKGHILAWTVNLSEKGK
jgi:hypothetical protein